MTVKDAIKLHEKSILLRASAPSYDPLRSEMQVAQAEHLSAVANNHLKPAKRLETCQQGEIVPPMALGMSGLELALKEPDLLDAEVTIKRSELAEKAGVFEMAFEVAQSVKAKNSLQRMQAHQLAAAHKFAMELLSDASKVKDPLIKAKLINASARLQEAFTRGTLALQKLQTGASQVVQVQHVQVNGPVIGNVGR